MKIYNEKTKSHDITDVEWEKCLGHFNYSCAYCGITQEDAIKTYSNRLHREHVDCNGADDLSNCAPACKSCNSRKHTFELSEWYDSDNLTYTKKRYEKIINWLESNAI